MLTNLLSTITAFVIHTISTLGYSGVAVLMAIESACIPLPSEVIAPFAGFLAYSGRFTLWGVALAGGVGSMLGSWLTYEIGRWGGRPLVEKYGKYILISRHDLDVADQFFAKHGDWSTFVGRLLPVVRTFISLPAGIARVPLKSFLAYSFIGSVIWTYVLAYIGFKLGENWESLRGYFHKFDYLIVGLIVIGIVWWIWRHFRNARIENAYQTPIN